MVNLKNLSRDKLSEIGAAVGNSFYEDEGAYRAFLTRKECMAYFQAAVDASYEAGYLYTTSDKEEGFLAFWHKEEKPNMACKLMQYMSKDSLLKLMRGLEGWTGYERHYSNENDYLSLFLIVVRSEYKRKGILRRLMELPYSISWKENIPCFLDTDTDMKANIYMHVGMSVAWEKMLDSGQKMYTMAYWPNRRNECCCSNR